MIYFRDVFRKTKDDQNNCLIHYLAKRSCNGMMKDEKYVKKSDSNIPGYCGMAPIHFAARYGTEFKATEKTLQMMMDFMENPHQEDEFGNTVLHHAILNKNIRYPTLYPLNRLERSVKIFILLYFGYIGYGYETKFLYRLESTSKLIILYNM